MPQVGMGRLLTDPGICHEMLLSKGIYTATRKRHADFGVGGHMFC